jgi:hypothetical protein
MLRVSKSSLGSRPSSKVAEFAAQTSRVGENRPGPTQSEHNHLGYVTYIQRQLSSVCSYHRTALRSWCKTHVSSCVVLPPFPSFEWNGSLRNCTHLLTIITKKLRACRLGPCDLVPKVESAFRENVRRHTKSRFIAQISTNVLPSCRL